MKKFTDETPMPFGKHKGKPVGDVPASYLLWWYDADNEDLRYVPLRTYIKEKKDQLEAEVNDERRYDECDATESDIY